MEPFYNGQNPQQNIFRLTILDFYQISNSYEYNRINTNSYFTNATTLKDGEYE